jgi:hypothetical protein
MIFAYAELINKAESTMAAALVGLNVIAILFAIVSIVLLLRMPANKPDRR